MSTELDRICCEFAEIYPDGWAFWFHGERVFRSTVHLSELAANQARDWNRDRGSVCDPACAVYPPVSTSWEAAGRLMEALHRKNLAATEIACDWRNSKSAWSGYASNPHEGEFRKYADSGPMALALAVVELAKRGAK